MILRLRGNEGLGPRLRLGIVAPLLLALLAFPCGPLVALGTEAGYALAAAHAAAMHSKHGEAECTHRAKKHESSCCNDCSDWLTSRFYDGPTAILAAHKHDLPAVRLAYADRHAKLDRTPRLTGPPSVASLDGTSIYKTTRRFRI